MQSTAVEVEAELNNTDVGQTLDATVEAVQTMTKDDLVEKGAQAFGVTIGAAQGAKHQVEDKTDEWKRRRSAALNEAEDVLMARIQEVSVSMRREVLIETAASDAR